MPKSQLRLRRGSRTRAPVTPTTEEAAETSDTGAKAKRARLQQKSGAPSPATATPAETTDNRRKSTRKRTENVSTPVLLAQLNSSPEISPPKTRKSARTLTATTPSGSKSPAASREETPAKKSLGRLRKTPATTPSTSAKVKTPGKKSPSKPKITLTATSISAKEGTPKVPPRAFRSSRKEDASAAEGETPVVSEPGTPRRSARTTNTAPLKSPSPQQTSRNSLRQPKKVEAYTPSKPNKPATKKTPEASSELTKRTTPRSTTRRNQKDVTTEKTPSTAKKAVEKKSVPPPKGIKPIDGGQGEDEGKLEWRFNVYGVPKCPLPCRENQFEEIWKFLFENITEKNSGCMYVSGVPGTGKTVIVQAVVETMAKLNEENEKKKNLDFQHLYINGLTLASPDKIWKRMFKGLKLPKKSKSISTKEALKRLNSYFEGRHRTPVVLVVDELDQILDKQQAILYQLLEWCSHATNMLSFVAIFNTMSLPEQFLAMRNNSRMGFKRSVFPPYNYEQLQTIVSNMLETFKSCGLSKDCVSLISRKVAAISGDARRALEIARRTVEIAEAGNLSGIHAVSNAFKEIFSSAKIETIKHTSLLEQLVLKTICHEITNTGVEQVLTAKIYDGVIPQTQYEGMFWAKDEIIKALMRLAVMRLVLVEDNSPSLHKRVLLKVPVEDVNFALGIHSDLEG